MRLRTQWNWTSLRRAATVPVFVLFSPMGASLCQAPPPAPDMQEQVRGLNDAINRVQSQIDDAQRELSHLKTQLSALQPSPEGQHPVAEEQRNTADAAELSAAVAGIRETVSIHDTQIATLAQEKVESESKYPLKLSGLILMTGFVNTQDVDMAQSPTIALAGPGSTAATARQTILGIDARGPHLFGATSHADLRMDFDAGEGGLYSGGNGPGVLRMRTAHAELTWERTKAYLSYDRPIFNPDNPTSLTAVATSPLATSGNLWTWNPQLGVSRDLIQGHAAGVRVEGALIDPGDSPLYNIAQAGAYLTPTTAEQSRWPGIEGRIAAVSADPLHGFHLGFSGYFAPHRVHIPQAVKFNSWAAALDFASPSFGSTQFTASAYHGQALGGLGGGAYKDYVARMYLGDLYVRALGDSGGWIQWKQRAGERIEFNEAFGIDNVPAHQLRPFVVSYAASNYNLARNRTITANAIYSPSAYLLFSLEYRRIASSYVNYPTQFSDVIGLAAGYKF